MLLLRSYPPEAGRFCGSASGVFSALLVFPIHPVFLRKFYKKARCFLPFSLAFPDAKCYSTCQNLREFAGYAFSRRNWGAAPAKTAQKISVRRR